MGAAGGCPFCGSSGREVLYAGMRDRLKLYGKQFDVIRCLGCGSAMINDIPPEDELKGLYPAAYTVKEDGRRGPLMDLWVKAEMRLFYERVYAKDVRGLLRATGMRPGRVLDVGCGNGGRMKAFSHMGFDAEGIETSRADVEYINGRLNLKARLGSLTELDFPAGSYSAITFFNVFEHLPDPAETAEKAFRLLMPGGWIAVSGPFMDGVEPRLFGRRWIEVAEMPRHLFIPTTGGLARLLGRVGFTDFSHRSVGTAKLAHTIAESLAPFAIGSAAYRRGGLPAMANRTAGALVMLLSMPLALVEHLSGRASVRLFVARKPGGKP